MNIKILFICLFFITHICESKDKILIVTEEWPPYNYTNKHGEIVGTSTEIIKQVMAKANLEYRIEIYSWTKAYQIAKNTPNTLIYTIYRIPDRESTFHWFCPLNGTQSLNFYSLKTSNDIQVTNLEDVKNYLVGAVNHDVTFNYLVSKKFKVGQHLAIASDEFANVRKLLKGRVDLIIQEEQALKFRLKREGVEFSKLKKIYTLFDKSLNINCMALNLNTPEHIIKQVSQAFKLLTNKN